MVKDKEYLIGKIIEVNYTTSRVLLLSDINSKIPVLIEPQGLLSILSGSGDKEGVIQYSKAENITEEIEEEDLDHQFFYTVGSGLDVTTEYTSFDSAGNELGLTFLLNTAGASSGGLTFTLRHEPNKPNTGLADAGGETDIEVTFDVAVVD